MFKPLPLISNKTRSPIYQTYRSPKMHAAYLKQMEQTRQNAASTACALCDKGRTVVQEHGPIRVIKNDYPYAVFQGMPVREHLMVITARHVGGLSELTYEEAAVYWRICAEYSGRDYTLFTQAATKSQRSIPGHIHTHLILCGGSSE
jgi:hypothetical protein